MVLNVDISLEKKTSDLYSATLKLATRMQWLLFSISQLLLATCRSPITATVNMMDNRFAIEKKMKITANYFSGKGRNYRVIHRSFNQNELDFHNYSMKDTMYF